MVASPEPWHYRNKMECACGVWDDRLNSVLFGVGDKITGNTGTGSCMNVAWPCS